MWELNVVVDGEELPKNNKRKKIQKFYKHIDVNSVTNDTDEIEVSMVFLAVIFLGG